MCIKIVCVSCYLSIALPDRVYTMKINKMTAFSSLVSSFLMRLNWCYLCSEATIPECSRLSQEAYSLPSCFLWLLDIWIMKQFKSFRFFQITFSIYLWTSFQKSSLECARCLNIHVAIIWLFPFRGNQWKKDYVSSLTGKRVHTTLSLLITVCSYAFKRRGDFFFFHLRSQSKRLSVFTFFKAFSRNRKGWNMSDVNEEIKTSSSGFFQLDHEVET